jgi:hypothetical protein
MEIISKRLPADHNLILFSDAHYGTSLFQEKALHKVLSIIEKEPNTFGAFGGDIAEIIMIDDPRYNPETDRKWTPLQQYRKAKDDFGPVAPKMLFTLMGNHDWKVACKYGNYIKEEFCDQLKIPYGTYTTKLRVENKKGGFLYKLFYTHGAKSITSTADDPIRQEANLKLQLKRRLQKKAGDCEVMAMGHTHKLLVAEPMANLYLYDDGEEIQSAYTQPGSEERWIHPDHRWYLNTGSFLTLYGPGISGYGELFGYDPIEIGCCVIECRNGKIKNVRKMIL